LADSSSSPPRSSWNQNHPYSTHFKKCHLANIATYNDISSTLGTPFDDSRVLHYGNMLHDPDQASFEIDMQREMNDLLHTNTVELAPHSAVPTTIKVLQAIWSFRWKHAPDWSILKYKSCLCPHGGQQIEGEHFWETYAPVVNWHTVRLVLILRVVK